MTGRAPLELGIGLVDGGAEAGRVHLGDAVLEEPENGVVAQGGVPLEELLGVPGGSGSCS